MASNDEWQDASLFNAPNDDPELQAAIANSIGVDNTLLYHYGTTEGDRDINPQTGESWKSWDHNLPERLRNMNNEFWHQGSPQRLPQTSGQPGLTGPWDLLGPTQLTPHRRQHQKQELSQQLEQGFQSYQRLGPSNQRQQSLAQQPGFGDSQASSPAPQQQPQTQPGDDSGGNPFAVLGMNSKLRNRDDINVYEQQALRHRPENDTSLHANTWPTRTHVIQAAQLLRDHWDRTDSLFPWSPRGQVWRPNILPGRRGVFPFPHARTYEVIHARNHVSPAGGIYGRWTGNSEHKAAPLRAPGPQFPSERGPSLHSPQHQPQEPYGPPQYSPENNTLIWPQEWQTFWEEHNVLARTIVYRSTIAGPHNGPHPMYQRRPRDWIRYFLARLRGEHEINRATLFHELIGWHLPPDWAQFFGRDLWWVNQGIWITYLTDIVSGRPADWAIQGYNEVEQIHVAQAAKAGPLTQTVQNILRVSGTEQIQQPTQPSQPAKGTSRRWQNDPLGIYNADNDGDVPTQPADDTPMKDTPMGGGSEGDGGEPGDEESSDDDDNLPKGPGLGRTGPRRKRSFDDLSKAPHRWGRYDDDGPPKPWESRDTYETRIHRARHNMQIKRRPAHPAGFFVRPKTTPGISALMEQARRKEKEHQEKLRNDREYRANWVNAQAARRAQNTQRRRVAFEHKNREYEKILLRPIECQPDPPDDSDNEEYFERQAPTIRDTKPRFETFEDRDREPFRCKPCKIRSHNCTYNYELFPCGPCRRNGTEAECVSVRSDEDVRKKFNRAYHELSRGSYHFHHLGPFIPSYSSTLGNVSPLAQSGVWPLGRPGSRSKRPLRQDNPDDERPPKKRQGVKGRRGGNKPRHRCSRCRKRKSGCDGNRPCNRCKEANLAHECDDDEEDKRPPEEDGQPKGYRPPEGNRQPREGFGVKKIRPPISCSNCHGTNDESRCGISRPCSPCREKRLEATCNVTRQNQLYQMEPDDAMDIDGRPPRAPNNSGSNDGRLNPAPTVFDNVIFGDEDVQIMQREFEYRSQQWNLPDDEASSAAEAITANDQINQYDPPDNPQHRPQRTISPPPPDFLDNYYRNIQANLVIASRSAAPGLKLPFEAPRWKNPDLPLAPYPDGQLDPDKRCREMAGQQFWSYVRDTAYAEYGSSAFQEQIDRAEQGPSPRKRIVKIQGPGACGTVNKQDFEPRSTFSMNYRALTRDPARDCEHLRDEWMCSCANCRTDQDHRMRLFHREDDLVERTKKWFCKDCHNDLKQRRATGNAPPNLKISHQCDCIAQLRDPWLCNAHRLGAKCDVGARIYPLYRRSELDGNFWLCPGCKYTELDVGEKSETWECRSCSGIVQLP